MDIEFKVVRSSKPSPNRATIILWNLNPEHRAQLNKRNRPDGPNGHTKPVFVKLEAGYVDNHSVLLYADMRELTTVRVGTDWKTTLAVDDGGTAVREARFDKGGVSFAAGTPIGTVLREVARTLGLGLGNVADFVATAQILGINTPTLPGRMTFTGSAHDALKRVCSTIGVGFSIQGGVLQLLGKGKALNTAAILLSPSTGLVGSPEAAVDSTVSLPFAKEAKGTVQKSPQKLHHSNTAILKAKALLIPGLVPGRVVKMDSAAFNGNYTITDAEYSGQSFGSDWTTSLVLRSYG